MNAACMRVQMEICNDSDLPGFAAANFPLSGPKDKHVTMQILLKGKYYIYILEPQPDISITETGEGKATRKHTMPHL